MTLSLSVIKRHIICLKERYVVLFSFTWKEYIKFCGCNSIILRRAFWLSLEYFCFIRVICVCLLDTVQNILAKLHCCTYIWMTRTVSVGRFHFNCWELQSISQNFCQNIPNFVESSQVRCEVQKFILKFKSQFVNKAPIGPWIEIIQSNALFKKPACDFQYELWTWQRTCELWKEIWNILAKALWNRL